MSEEEACADAGGDDPIAGDMRESAEAGREIDRRAAYRVGDRRADIGGGLGENSCQRDERIFVGQMIGHPEPIEGILRHCPFRVRGRRRSGGQGIKLHAEAHFQ
jgi:hypothetical protein